MTKTSTCLTLLLESAYLLTNTCTILPRVSKSICSSGIISTAQWLKVGKHPCRENTSLCTPLVLLLPKDKAFAFPRQTQNPQTSPMTPLPSLLRWCWHICDNAHKRAGVSKSVTSRLLWYWFLQIPICFSLSFHSFRTLCQLFDKMLQVTTH